MTLPKQCQSESAIGTIVLDLFAKSTFFTE
ncbi:unnamed protein product, partial [Didymodactylos carnosus]